MAEEFLEGIYKEAFLYTRLREMTEYARCDLDSNMTGILREVIPELNALSARYIDKNETEGKTFLKLLHQMTECADDEMRIADLMETAVLPELEKYLRTNACISVDDEDGFRLESSCHGFLTIQDTTSNTYLHSTWDPMWEAREQIRVVYDPKAEGYAMLGCGLGYHVYQLYCISEGSIKIHIFEKDPRIVQYAMQYGVLSWIPEDCIEVTVGDDLLPFLECAERYGGAYFIFGPDVKRMEAAQYEVVEPLYIGQCTRAENDLLLHINYYRNTACGASAVSELDTASFKEDFVVVAGGPSVDTNMDFLRENIGEMTIIAVGTVFRKLVQAGIRPDLVTVLDPTKWTMRQLAGVEEETIPLLLATSAYWGWATSYKGKIYLVPVMNQLQEQEDYAAAHGMKPWNVGGTVTTLAVEAALRFGAKRIYLVGADFAYPGGLTHASGTDMREKRDVSNMMAVESVKGDIVYTAANMNMYRQELEEIIAQNPAVDFVNKSDVGAKIYGTRVEV